MSPLRELDPQTPLDEVAVCKVRSTPLFAVPIKVGNHSLKAVVDTAAEISIISHKVYEKLQPCPQKIRDVFISADGRDLRMPGMIVDPIRIKLGGCEFLTEVCVAPIEGEMLLGLDLLRKYRIILHLQHSRLEIGNVRIPMMHGEQSPYGRASCMCLLKRAIIPPNTLKRITGVIHQPEKDLGIKFTQDMLGGIPRYLCSKVKGMG